MLEPESDSHFLLLKDNSLWHCAPRGPPSASVRTLGIRRNSGSRVSACRFASNARCVGVMSQSKAPRGKGAPGPLLQARNKYVFGAKGLQNLTRHRLLFQWCMRKITFRVPKSLSVPRREAKDPVPGSLQDFALGWSVFVPHNGWLGVPVKQKKSVPSKEKTPSWAMGFTRFLKSL